MEIEMCPKCKPGSATLRRFVNGQSCYECLICDHKWGQRPPTMHDLTEIVDRVQLAVSNLRDALQRMEAHSDAGKVVMERSTATGNIGNGDLIR